MFMLPGYSTSSDSVYMLRALTMPVHVPAIFHRFITYTFTPSLTLSLPLSVHCTEPLPSCAFTINITIYSRVFQVTPIYDDAAVLREELARYLLSEWMKKWVREQLVLKNRTRTVLRLLVQYLVYSSNTEMIPQKSSYNLTFLNKTNEVNGLQQIKWKLRI